jgi:3'-phosphoadenosine 5'-phosphosulfate sulfotransferase (PAPS reductase)/FAD synthetase
VSILRVVSVSGGKDSTALYCWAIDQWGKDGFKAIFADTGHEHPVTLNYLRNLPAMAGGPEIEWVKADFSERLRKRGKEPSGNPFLDMMLWKGRAPSSQAQFCTEHLKLRPIQVWLERVRGDSEVVMYTGIRAGESARRAKMPESEHHTLFDCENVRPLLRWTEQQVFDFLKAKGVPPNPLYAAGFSRVGCFPCIHATKDELASLPEWAWDKLEEWEARLGRSWFAAGKIPGVHIPTIKDAREWARTSRGGTQFNMFAEDAKDVPSCMSTWGACE